MVPALIDKPSCYSISRNPEAVKILHDDVIKWKYLPHYWPFVWGIQRSPVNFPHRGQWRGSLMFSLICAWTDTWANSRGPGDWRWHRAHYDITSTNLGLPGHIESWQPNATAAPVQFWYDMIVLTHTFWVLDFMRSDGITSYCLEDRGIVIWWHLTGIMSRLWTVRHFVTIMRTTHHQSGRGRNVAQDALWRDLKDYKNCHFICVCHQSGNMCVCACVRASVARSHWAD